MKKTAKEWYQQLPEPIRSEAIAEWEKKTSVRWNDLFNSLADALMGGFCWHDSPQYINDSNYWANIHNRIERGEFDKPTQNLHGWIPVGERLPTKKDADMEGVVLAINFMNQQRVYHYTIVRKKNRGIQFWQPLPKLPEVKS